MALQEDRPRDRTSRPLGGGRARGDAGARRLRRLDRHRLHRQRLDRCRTGRQRLQDECGGQRVAAKTADEILSEATAAFRGASSAHLVGRLADADQSVELDVRLGRDVSQGSVTQKGAKLEIIATGGNLYMRGKQFWVTNAPASIASQVGDRWARVPVSGLRKSLAFTNLTSLQAFADGGLKPSGTLSKGERGTVEGAKAIAIKDGDGGSLWVATTGPAYPLRIGPAAATASADSIAFRDYNAELSVTAPSDSIDFTQVTG